MVEASSIDLATLLHESRSRYWLMNPLFGVLRADDEVKQSRYSVCDIGSS